MHCLVTGATGFIGRGLVTALAKEGCRVTALARSASPAPGPESTVRRRRCDLRDPGANLDCETVDIVFHLAGVAHQYATAAEYASVNVEGTLRLARAALAASVRRFVFFSSVKAIRPFIEDRENSADRDDRDSRPPPRDYSSSKAVAESELRALCSGSPMELVILRPALVYAVDSPGHLAWLRRWVDLHMPAPPDVGERSMISREDVIRLAVELLDLSRSPPAEITATDGQTYSLRRLHSALCESRGRRPWLPSPPAAAWRAFAAAFDRLSRAPPGSTWQRLAGHETYQARGLDSLAFSPRLTFETCLDANREARR